MPRPALVARHPSAGNLEAIRLAVRVDDSTVAPPAEASTPLASAAPLEPGTRRFGDLEVSVEFETDETFTRIRSRVHNAGDEALFLGAVVLGFRWSGHGVGPMRFLRHGWQSWSFTGVRDLDEAGEPAFPSGAWLRGMHHAVSAPPPDRAGWHESDLVTVAGASPSGPACLVGLLERGVSFGVVYARRAGDDVEVELEIAVEAPLAPGESLDLETARVALGLEASALLEVFADDLSRVASARSTFPFRAGWCSWYHFFHDVTEDDVLRNLEALARERETLPVDVVQIDDGYQRAVGDWLETNAKFPRGIAFLASEIRAAGFIPGLWTAPFCVVAESELFAKRREWLLTSGAESFRALLHPEWSRGASVYALDTSREDVLAHLRELFASLGEMGFTYLKLDFLYAVAMRAGAAEPRVTRAGRLRRGLAAIRAGAGDEAFLLGCGSPLGASVGVVDAMRIGPDVAPRWRPREGARIPGLEETVPATRSAVRSVLLRAWMHRRLWINDPDCLMARSEDTELTRDERETLATAIAATGGMVVFSDDVPRLSDESRDLVRRTLEASRAVDALGIPGAARVPDLLAREIPDRVVAADAADITLALLQADDTAAEHRIDDPELSLSGRTTSLLGAEPTGGDGIRVSLEAHQSALLRAEGSFDLAVFCDFDGTFSVQDVGSTLARRHAGPRRPATWARYERGEITAWEYNMDVLDGLEIPQSDVEAFLRTVDLDPGAKALVDWCERGGVPFRILSDGFDWNLCRLQQIHGVRFAFDANRLDFERGVWRIGEGHPNPACDCGTGTCKRGRIEALAARHPAAKLVHIGNGRVSDLCGALAADVTFAKDSLAEELDRRGVAYHGFDTLHDVIPRLEDLRLR